MGIAFSDRADFNNITSGQRLKISTVKQKTFVDVDEKGTKAAAATNVPESSELLRLGTSAIMVPADRPLPVHPARAALGHHPLRWRLCPPAGGVKSDGWRSIRPALSPTRDVRSGVR